MNQSESGSPTTTTTTRTTSAATINAQDNENANASSGEESQLMEARGSRESPTENKNKNKIDQDDCSQQTNAPTLNKNIIKEIQTLLNSTEPTLNSEQTTSTASETTTSIANSTASNSSANINNIPNNNNNNNNNTNNLNYITLTDQAAQVVADAASQLKILAPAMTRDMTIPNTGKKVPMVMVPVPNTGHLIAIPLSTINQLKDSDQTIMDCVSKDEEQARDLLNWEDGIGTLEGCDLRFKINELGNLELIDSDDESENQKHYKKQQYQANINQQQQQQQLHRQTKQTKQNAVNNKKQQSNNAISSSNQSSSSDDIKFHPKKARLEPESTPSVKQISPGSSLLRDGPDIRRPKSSTTTSNNSTTNSLARNNQLSHNNNTQANSSISLLKKVDTQSLNSILAEKIVPKQKLDEMRSNVDQWTIDEVEVFIDGIPGCKGYGELFKMQQICGKSLLYLDQRDLLDIINVKLGPAVKIYHAISLLKS